MHGLAVEDVEAMTAAVAGHDLDEEGVALAGEIAAETDGNPFFVGEILRNLAESGLVVFDEGRGRWQVDRSSGVALPESVREVVERRVAVLGKGARQTLTVAAVIGRSFDLELLARLVEIDETALLDQLEAAVQASLLRESTDQVGRFTFEHALINHTLYEGLGGSRRARVHQGIAEALEDLYGTDSGEQLAELALHWRLATVSVDKTKAARYAVRAGRQALDSLAPSEAAKLFADALELLGTDVTVERCEALIGLGEAQRQTGVPAHRETLLEASGIASELHDAELAARAALANNRGWTSGIGKVDVERVAAIERALELDDPPQPDRRARLLSLLAVELTFAPEHARRWALAEEAIALARQAGDPRTLAVVLADSAYACWAPDTLPKRAEYVRELMALVMEVQDLRVEYFAALRQTHIAMELCDFARADAALARIHAIAEQTRQPTLRWNVGFTAAAVRCTRGELEAGERLAEQALQIGQESGEPDAAMAYGATLITNRMYQGRGAEVIALLEQTVANFPGVPGLGGRAWPHVLLHRPPPRRRGNTRACRRAALRTPRLRPNADVRVGDVRGHRRADGFGRGGGDAVRAAGSVRGPVRLERRHGLRTRAHVPGAPRRDVGPPRGRPTRTSRSPAPFTTSTAYASGRLGPSSAGPRHSPTAARPSAPASTPPARSSSPASTATARSSHALPRSSPPTRRSTANQCRRRYWPERHTLISFRPTRPSSLARNKT